MRQLFRYVRLWLLIVLIGIGIFACEPQDDTTSDDPNAPILSGNGDMPKVLITIVLTPTPTDSPVTPTSALAVGYPTPTDEPPLPTFTPTPYVGVYIGPQSSGTPIAANPVVASQPGVSGVIPTLPAGSSSGIGCTVAVAAQFSPAHTTNNLSNTLGCPRNQGFPLTMVSQSFERGIFFWRSDTREIYGLQSGGNYLRVADTWQEGQPESDPNFVPPSGFSQPIRGFGLVWRSNGDLRNGVGWATTGEIPYSGYWQDFDRGAMFIADNNRVYALIPADGSRGRYLGPF